jgi:serine/threonine-protein kinase HipA
MADAPVGELIRKENGNLQFRYAEQYAGPPISQSLPVRDEAHAHQVVRAVFGGLLPEGDVRAVLARNAGISEQNDFRLLEEVGGDVAGALSLLPEGARPDDEARLWILDEAALDVVLRELPQRPLAADPEGGIRLSLAGAQAKLPVVIEEHGRVALPLSPSVPTTHILKPQPDRSPGLVDNEAFCTALASACELEVAKVEKAATVSGLPYLIVERYDRDLTADPIRRLQQEDFCQALGRPADRKYQQEGGPTVVESAQLLRTCSPIPALELPRLLRALIFNWVIGNCDAHGKNFSLLYDQGAPTLAPLYDLVSTVIYPELTTRLAMSIGAARSLDEVDLEAWDRLAREADYRPAFVRSEIGKLLERMVGETEDLIRTAPHDNETAATIADRIRRIADRHAAE